MKVTQVSVVTFLHETENSEKVLDALCNCLGLNRDDLSLEQHEGYHGNVIRVYKAILQRKKAELFIDNLFKKLSKADIVFILSSLEERVEGNRLHLRLDKQALIAECKPTVKDGDDVVKLVITFSGTVDDVASELSSIVKSN